MFACCFQLMAIIASSPVIYTLINISMHMIQAITSDYLGAGKVGVMQSVVGPVEGIKVPLWCLNATGIHN